MKIALIVIGPLVGVLLLGSAAMFARDRSAWRFVQLHLSVGVTNEEAIGQELPV